MALTRKDVVTTGLLLLVLLVFAAVYEGWNVPLVGDSYRWAGAVIFVLGAFMCGASQASAGGPRLFAALGMTAFVLAAIAVIWASPTALSLLVVDIVLLWLAATVRHAVGAPRTV